ncbi:MULTISPECIES: branched-chain amino acid ABC transporter permease [unclassified Mesorhizobium]|uniref:branched-chain amino acid ABC transporter permease n=1 Tax=unclassified Mesorhizobium TaxID=325217 RepID=UPI00109354E4|nr:MULTISPECIES: branched-chain amino acid ABC transporter permease [unclassified Mesorhizobium]TGT82847.1 branched-chain amino acid ABC transporter permease [Mesorhizobium sp. M8A.F.Ca.ET.161.01.1.1]TGV36448.1 branched-chain amino acid ABC transporter permease [Mesorhizobium sp. M8A.F.Ca.ET.142.01.1.1]TIT65276.1 MAG: branched-chain amino acid ABC transporter permease [Mesorhizobium sp.]
MSREARITLLVLAALVAGAAIAFGAPHVLSDYFVRIILLIALNAILVLALSLSNGFTGVFSLGHVGFIGAGAYISGILSIPVQQKMALLPHLPAFLHAFSLAFLPATLVAGLLTALLAVVVGYPLMRLSGYFVSVATMGFLIIVNVVLINASDFTRGARTFTGVPLETTLPWVMGWLAITLFVLARLVYSPFGSAMKAVRDDTIAASAVGIGVLRTRLIAFVTGAFFSGVGGSLYAHYLGSFSPNTFYFALTMSLITMLVLGGMGSLTGAIVGVICVSLLSEVLRAVERGFTIGDFAVPALFGASQIVLGFIFILIMIFRPNGIMGDRELTFGLTQRSATVNQREERKP